MPKRGKIKLDVYATAWIKQRPKLRPRTRELYAWLFRKHIEPHLGKVELGKLSTPMIRDWRSRLIQNGVSETVAAKAYRLLRAILMTAVDKDGILTRNPCKIKGAGNEDAPERPIFAIAQVFEIAELVGRRPVGNIRKTDDGFRLRYRIAGKGMRSFPEPFTTRAQAEHFLFLLMHQGRADHVQDDRLRALVLLAAFASLRWGEVTALHRQDLDLANGRVRIRVAFAEQDNGTMLLGRPKSRAGVRTIALPDALIPELESHLAKYTKPGANALVFTGIQGGPLRRSGFNKATRVIWTHIVTVLGLPGAHFHDLRHTGNMLAAETGEATTKDLMHRMGHDNERAAIRSQHASRRADKAIASGLNLHMKSAANGDAEEGDDGAAGALVPAG
ncbi:hypothetical protein GCM10027589_05360 [Actinocorallia lasiicapitis]